MLVCGMASYDRIRNVWAEIQLDCRHELNPPLTSTSATVRNGRERELDKEYIFGKNFGLFHFC